MLYNKPFFSLPDQLTLLKNRGLQVADDAKAIECLRRNGYYRLSAYWYPFRKITPASVPRRTNIFLPDSHFEDAIALYIFDKEFKLLLLDAIERVEIAVRVDLALRLGARDSFFHTKPQLLNSVFSRPNGSGNSHYSKWISKLESAVNGSRQEFIKHHKHKYGSKSPLPIWIAIELWDFGLLSHFFSGLNVTDKDAVAKRFRVPDWQVMESWLRSLNFVRNVIAHHGRLWNLNLVDRPKLPMQGTMSDFDSLIGLANFNSRIYSACCILCHFSHVINPDSTWPQQLVTKVSHFPLMPHATAQEMGFPQNWEAHTIWK